MAGLIRIDTGEKIEYNKNPVRSKPIVTQQEKEEAQRRYDSFVNQAQQKAIAKPGTTDSIVARYQPKSLPLSPVAQMERDKLANSDASPDTNWGRVTGGTLLKGADQFATGLTSTGAWLESAVLKPVGSLLGDKNLYQQGILYNLNEHMKKAQEQNQQAFAKDFEDAGTTGKLLDKYGTATVAAVPQAALAMLTAGSSLGAQATTSGLQTASAAATSGLAKTIGNTVSEMGKNPQYWLSFLQSAGNNYEQAKGEGANDLQATSYALLTSLVNSAVEISGGIDTLPKNLQGAAKAGEDGIKAWVKSALDEGREEVIQGAISQLTQTVYGKNNPLFGIGEDAVLSPSRALGEFKGGAIVGGILGGGQAIAGKVLSGSPKAVSEPFSGISDVDLSESNVITPPSAENAQNGVLRAITSDATVDAPMQPKLELPSVSDDFFPGKRVNAENFNQDQINRTIELMKAGEVGMDIDGNVFRIMPENHIDNRTSESVSSRKVNAFQYDHPNLHEFMKQAANDIIADADISMQLPTTRRMERTVFGKKFTQNITESAPMRAAMNEGLTRNQIIDSAKRLINDKGQENVAAAKRLEIILDDMLTNGYTTVDGRYVGPNQEYIAAKSEIRGAKGDYTVPAEELPIWDMNAPDTRTDVLSPDGVQSVGAAAAGFLGDTERGFARNIRTDRSMEQVLREDFQDDPEMYFKLSNKETLQKAVDIYSTGLDNARSILEQAIGSAKAGMKLSPEMVPLSRMVANQLARNGDAYSARKILTDISIELTDAGRLGQAGAIMRDADPAAKVMMVEKLANRVSEKFGKKGGISVEDANTVINSMLESRKETADDIRRTIEDLSEMVSSLEQQKIDAENVIREIYDGISGERGQFRSFQDIVGNIPGRQRNIPRYLSRIDSSIEKSRQDRWVYKLANALAKNAGNRASDKNSVKPIYSIILSDLNSFMNQYVSKGKDISPKRTAIDTLTDFFNNRQEYATAWNESRNILKRRYRDDPVMLDRLEDFIFGTLSYNATGNDSVMLKAIASIALENDIKIKDIVIKGKYDADSLINSISSDLIEKTGASGSDATAIIDAVSRYVSEKSSSAVKTAEQYIESDIGTSLKDIGIKLSDILVKGAKDKSDVANLVSDHLVKKYGISNESALDISKDIVEKFDLIVKERSRSKLESIFKAREASERKTFAKRFEELVNLGAFSSEFNESAVNKLFGVSGVTVDSDLVAEYANADTDADRDAAIDKIYQNIADQIPSSLSDKFTALRYLNMLGNLKTQVRNVGGNTVMYGVRSLDNKVKYLLESVASWKTKGEYDRTTTFTRDKALYDAAKTDFESFKSDALGEQKFSINSRSLPKQIQDKRTIFKNNGTWGTLETSSPIARALRKGSDVALSGLEKYRNLTNWAMETGDILFSKRAYADALARYLQAHGVTAEQFTGGNLKQEFLDTARAYAIQQAQEATFRDHNAFSDMIASIGFKDESNVFKKAANVALQGIIPFRRTPANVLVRAVEYSPAGIIETAVKEVSRRRGNTEITAQDVISSLSKNLTGTGLVILGAAMYNLGWLTAGKDDDEKQSELDMLTGKQEYALNIPKFITDAVPFIPEGTSATLDWMSPAIMPMAVGAELMKSASDEGYSFENLMNALGGMTNVMLNMSMLQGVNDQLSNVSYSDIPIVDIVANSFVDFVTQGTTSTLLGQAERSSEDVRMSTYTDKNLPIPSDIQYILGSASARTPGVDYQQIPFIDAWGRTEDSGPLGLEMFNQFLNPAYTSQENVTKLDEEVQRLYTETGESGVVPDRAPRYLTVGGERIDLSKDQYVEYATQRGQLSYQIGTDMIQNPVYQSLPDDQKADILDDVYTYADALAKMEVSNYTPPEWISKVDSSGVDPVTGILYHKSDANSETKRKMLMQDDSLSASEKLALDRALISETSDIDYSSEETFTISQMSDAGQRKWEKAQAWGMPYEDYAKYYPMIYAQGKKKAEIIQDLINAGMSENNAYTFWNMIRNG